MIIAIDKNLKELSKQLEDVGYNVIELKPNITADAIIYNSFYNNNSGLTNAMNTQTNNISNHGTLLIDGYNKNIYEINNILTKKIYSSLF